MSDNINNYPPKLTQFHAVTARTCLAVLALTFTLFAMQSANAAGWAGRPLTEILDELRADGLTIVYSSQFVSPDLKVAIEPTSQLIDNRLQEVLKPFGLETKPLGSGINGYVVVRSARNNATNESAAVTDVFPPEEITIYGSVYSIARQDTSRGDAVSGTTLENMAGTSQDALHAIHNFAGAASNSVSTLSHVRGGNDDETLIQFDGVELYEPVHLKDFQGLFGLLDPETIHSLNFFGGAYPARYGNHTAGMIDIEPRHLEQENLLGVSLLYTRALTMGSFNDHRGDWLFGYRHSSIPEVLRHLKRKIGDPTFEDFVGHFTYNWDTTKVTIGLLRLNDDLHLFTPSTSEQATGYFHDTYWWSRLEHDWGSALSSQLQISQAALRAQRNGQVNIDQISSGTLARTRDTLVTTILTDWSYALNTGRIQWGARMDRTSLQFQYSSQATYLPPLSTTFRLPPTLNRRLVGDPQGNLYSAYFSMRHGFKQLTGEVGLRWDDYDYIDHGDILSPRLHLQYDINSDSSFHFNAGRYVQARTASNLDISTTVLASRSPETSQQFVIGFDQLFSNQLKLRVDIYSKRNDHVRPYSENLLDIITLVPELRIDRTSIAPQHSSMRGLEVSLTSANEGSLNWWANYTYSQARDRINGADVMRSWDQPHAFNAGLNWNAARWKHSATYSWHTGWPNTPLQIEPTSNGNIAVLGARNSQRFNNYSALDARSDYRIPIHNGSLDLFFELRNAFNEANDCCRAIQITTSGSDQPTITLKQKAWIGWVPIAGFDWRF